MTTAQNILLIDDDPLYAEAFQSLAGAFLEKYRLDLVVFTEPEQAIEYIENNHEQISVIATDYKMPKMDGVEFIHAIEHPERDYQIIILSGRVDRSLTESALHMNIFDFFEKSTPASLIMEAMEKAHLFFLNKRETKLRLNSMLSRFPETKRGSLKDSLRPFHGLVGRGDSYLHLIDQIYKVAKSQATCFIRGESGTGKELVARAIHRESDRRDGPYVIINCGAIPHELFESEVFGHKKGSFTGATGDRQGLVEQADGGTLFLDEVTEMPLEMQVKLLRFLQDGSVQSVGSEKIRRVDVRVIAASNRDTEQAIREKLLREDLYYRLNVIPLRLPPLRERREDIPSLFDYYVDIFSELESRNLRGYDAQILEDFDAYYWPGNVRELRNVVHRIVIFSDSDWLGRDDLPHEIRNYRDLSSAAPHPTTDSLSLKEMERHNVERALQEARGNRDEAARMLGISRASIYRKIKEYGIDNR